VYLASCCVILEIFVIGRGESNEAEEGAASCGEVPGTG